MASSASAIPVAGWVIAAGILLAILGIAIGTAVANNVAYGKSAENAADNINKLSNEIYKLTEKANAIKSIEDQYDALDKKIIKTAEDQAKMNELLDGVSDKLSTENEKDDKGKDIQGTSEKDKFDALETEQEKRAYLQKVEADARKEANEKRREQIRIIQNLSAEERKELLTNKENADYLKAQSAVRAIVNNQLYETIDALKDVGAETEAFTQAILDQMDAEELYKYAQQEKATAIKALVKAVDEAITTINGEQIR
jgi:hypothetical protein